MSYIKAPERKIPVNKAISHAFDILNKLPIIYKIDYIFVTTTIYTTIVTIYDKNTNKYITQGNGKGISDQSVASALYESLEHYFLEKQPTTPVISLNINKIMSQNIMLNTEAPLYEILSNDSHNHVLCCKFYEYNNNNTIYYPSSLISPEYCVSDEFEAYSSNNGVSCGYDIDESILHSVCELIERQSISKLYINIISDNLFIMTKITKDSIPKNIIEIINEVESKYKLEMEIFDITYYDNLPVYVALFRTQYIPIYGSGCSVDSDYALERAVLECMQQLHLYNSESMSEDISIINLFSKSDEIINAIKLCSTNITLKKYEHICPDNNMGVLDMLNFISSQLGSYEYKIYYHIIERMDNFICCKVIIPGFEKFHLIRYGCAVCANKQLQ